MCGLSDLKQPRVDQEALAEGEEQGLERGLQEGERLVVENLLRVRFGELDPPLQAIISRILHAIRVSFSSSVVLYSYLELIILFPPEKSREN